jgi:hypothetical protein
MLPLFVTLLLVDMVAKLRQIEQPDILLATNIVVACSVLGFTLHTNVTT